MRKDSRLSRVLHILVHMDVHDGPLSSTHIAEMLSTNPVVVRRIMGALRERGFVQSTKGRDGGWVLACPLAHITLLDIHSAFGESSLFAIGLTDEHKGCLVERAINAELDSVLSEAEALVLERFSEITLEVLSK